ncbi:MAG: restriction endonuclease [Bacteroidetes bacterium]|nr:restriction endonuclease [Bacteroidota bacterium]
MPPLATNLRRDLERAVINARKAAERGARSALGALTVPDAKAGDHLDAAGKDVRNRLRAHARQLGDKRSPNGEQAIRRLVRECAYEHWHRMLFARFLAENDRAFLADELGLEKVKECLAAIKFLFQNRIVHSSLIIVPTQLIGYDNEKKKIGSDSGWIGSLIKYCPELSYSVIKGNDDERSDAWNKSALVYITDYETMLNDFHLKILEHKRLSQFECIIMDEIQLLLEKSSEGEKVFRKAHPTVFWVLSSLTDNALLGQVNDILSGDNKIEKYRINNLFDVSVDSPTLLQKEFWLEPSEYQQVEYKETFNECKKEFKKVLESGNPLRFQSNIFTLVHKLYQVENFAKAYETSPKTELLIQHLKIIQGNKQKVIILSQYDRQGTKKIEKLLDHFKISYVSVPAGVSAEDMKKSISLFKNKKTITALLSNAKESRLNFGSHLVPYIIKFDSWWNPVMNWQLEQIFNLDSKKIKKLNINVFTYKMLNSIDEDIKRTLLRKELFDKNILSVIPISMFNDLISVDEWLKIFDMPVNDEQENLQTLYDETVENLNNLSPTDFRATLSRFFVTLGYTNIKILEHENSESFDISGKGKSGNQNVQLFSKVLIDEIITRKKIKQIIFDVPLSQKNNTFIITRGKFENGCTEIAKNNVSLLDIEKLAEYSVNLGLVQPHSEQPS